MTFAKKDSPPSTERALMFLVKEGRCMDEIQDVIPLLYINGMSAMKLKPTIGKLIGKKWLSRIGSHENHW